MRRSPDKHSGDEAAIKALILLPRESFLTRLLIVLITDDQFPSGMINAELISVQHFDLFRNDTKSLFSSKLKCERI